MTRDLMGKSSSFELVLPGLESQKTAQGLLEFFAAQIRNSNTRSAYLMGLRAFIKFIDGKSLESATSIDTAAFIETHPGSIATRKLHLSAIRTAFHYLQLKGLISHNPGQVVKAPKLRRTRGKTPILSKIELKMLLDGLYEIGDVIALRDRALIGLMVFACPRISAALSIRVGDYLKGGEGPRIRFLDKGSKTREIPVNSLLAEIFNDYLLAAEILGDDDGPFFRVTRGSSGVLKRKPMNRHDAYQMIKRRARRFGLSDEISNHSFRGTGITMFLKNGGTIEKAQELAGHASIDTTRLYDRRSDEIMRSELERISF